MENKLNGEKFPRVYVREKAEGNLEKRFGKMLIAFIKCARSNQSGHEWNN